jgi:hypothetical protein
MKHLAFAILSLALVACSRPSSTTETTETPSEPLVVESAVPKTLTDRDLLNGVWQLATFEQNESDGNVSHPYGEMPVGRLTFDAAGRMSVFVMKPGRVASVNTTAAIATATAADLRQIADGFMAYYGHFRIEDDTKTLITQVEACTIPAWTGTEQKRTYELAGDTLTLITPATKLTWMRLPN